MTKEEMEAVWKKPGCLSNVARIVWMESGYEAGEELKPKTGKSAEAFMRKVRKHWGPPPMAYCGTAKPIMPKWLRERYKQNCPRNYKELCEAYGKGPITKYDAEGA